MGIGIARFRSKGLGLQGLRLKVVVRNPGLIPLWGGDGGGVTGLSRIIKSTINY